MALAEVFEKVAGPGGPVEFRAYDGSASGTAEAPVRITVRSPAAVSYLAQAPGSLGLARAYVSGNLDVDGDMYTALARITSAQQVRFGLAERLRLLGQLGGPKLLFPRLPPPPQEVRVSRRWAGGRRHSKGRDASAISHHYDVSNTFYQWVLGPSMSYTCACFPDEDASLEQAQAYKHDLVARKLGLQPGMRLLDVGCGWGGMVRHAAREYGVKALGVTLSAQQAAWGQQAIEEAGLADLAEVRHLDYRDVPEAGFDAVSSIGLTEHIGKAQLPGYFSFLFGKLKPGGRLLNHCITRPDDAEPARRARGFINRYVFPDGELEGPGIAHERRRVRDPPRGEPARALRADAGRLVRQPGRALGRGGRRGRRGHGAGLAPVHGWFQARFRAQRGGAAPDPRRQARCGRPLGDAAAAGLGAGGIIGGQLAPGPPGARA
jgi:cyclopropane-fatty-acyl-phospholipid synthase